MPSNLEHTIARCASQGKKILALRMRVLWLMAIRTRLFNNADFQKLDEAYEATINYCANKV